VLPTAVAVLATTIAGTIVSSGSPSPCCTHPNNGGKVKGKGKGKGRGRRKERTIAPTAPTTTAGLATPRCGPPSTIPEPVPSRCGQGCALLSNRCIHCHTPCLLHRHTMVPPVALPSRPCRRPHRTSSKP
jgi:hypothetical protein